MKKYFTPELQTSRFTSEDVLTISAVEPTNVFTDAEGNIIPGGEGDIETDIHFLP